MQINDYPDFLSIKDVSEILRVGTSQVYVLLRNGDIKSAKIGNKWRVPKEAIIEYKNKILKSEDN